jgi:hypothetical protein|tara:strand:+ start:765 stop:950 length:186 start_codon:yes stop_codon:yes gene_type:complete
LIITDDDKNKKENKDRDNSLKDFIKENEKRIDKLNVIRNSSGEIVLWEVSYLPIKEKEVSE